MGLTHLRRSEWSGRLHPNVVDGAIGQRDGTTETDRPTRLPSSVNESFNRMIAAIFQARLGSSRLPGKVLMDICGKPLLWHVIERVKAARTLDDIIVATTDMPEDAPLREFLEQQDVKVFVGSEADVLDRFYQAAKHYGAEVIVRITPDDPFKDPEVIDRAVRLLVEADPPVDYVSNCSYDGSIRVTYPEGIDVEVMTFDCLNKMWQRADRPSEREHLTPYLFSMLA